MLMIWTMPEHRFNSVLKGLILDWLDLMGKWSFMDSQFLILMAVAFHYELGFNGSVHLQMNVYSDTGI